MRDRRAALADETGRAEPTLTPVVADGTWGPAMACPLVGEAGVRGAVVVGNTLYYAETAGARTLYLARYENSRHGLFRVDIGAAGALANVVFHVTIGVLLALALLALTRMTTGLS